MICDGAIAMLEKVGVDLKVQSYVFIIHKKILKFVSVMRYNIEYRLEILPPSSTKPLITSISFLFSMYKTTHVSVLLEF